MKQFDVRAVFAGERVVRELRREGGAPEDLRTLLEAEGHLVISLREVTSSGRAGGLGALLARRKKFDLMWWSREMSTLLRAGMTIVEALEAMLAQSGALENSPNAYLLRRLREGKPLSAALHESGCFPQVLIAGVIASERTGKLVEAIDDFSAYHQQIDSLRRQTVSAAVYPAVVSLVGIVVVAFLLIYVLPRFAGIYDSVGADVSMATALVLSAGRLANEHHWMSVVLIIIVTTGLLLGLRSGLWQRAAFAVIVRLPYTRRILDDFNRAKFYQALGVTLRGGYTLDEAMAVCESLRFGGELEDRIGRARAFMLQGKPASFSFHESGISDGISHRMLGVAERGGQFVFVLHALAERHASNFSHAVQRATRLAEPIFLLGVSVLVGAVVVLMYMPIFDIANSLS